MKISCLSLTTTPLGNSRCLEQPNLLRTFPIWSKIMTRMTWNITILLTRKLLYVTPVFCPLRWTSEENIFARGDKIFLKGAKIYLYLALDNNDPALVVHADAAGVLEYVRAKLPDELSVLVVDLNLMRGRPGGRQNINLLPQQISQINIIHAIYLFAGGGRGATLLIAGVGLTADGLMWTLDTPSTGSS